MGRCEAPKCTRRVPSHVKDYQRKQLLERIEREGATVGASIPEEITIQGESIRLQEFIFETRRRETVPEAERSRVEQAKKNLRRERLERKQRIESDEISFEEGEGLAASIVGIDRALNELENLGTVDLEAQERAHKMADQQRWLEFLRKATGGFDTDTSRRSLGR